MSGFTRIVCETSGRTFCVVWLLALLAFPLVKGMPAGYLAVALGGAGGIVLLRSRATERLLDAAAVLSTRRFLVLLLLVAVGLRVVAVFYFPLEPQVDDEQFHRYATSMLRGEGYGAPGVRAWFPPGMSLLLTAWYAVTGPSALAGKFLQVVVACALVWQTWAAARTCCDERTARLAAILVAVFPTLVFYTATLGYELVLALILLVVCRLAGAAATSATRNVLYAAAVGALLGVGALVKPICILMPVLLALAWWTAGVSWSRVLTRVATVTVVMVLIIAPWTIRNYRVLGAFVPVSTNGGQTLYSANNPKPQPISSTRASCDRCCSSVSRKSTLMIRNRSRQYQRISTLSYALMIRVCASSLLCRSFAGLV